MSWWWPCATNSRATITDRHPGPILALHEEFLRAPGQHEAGADETDQRDDVLSHAGQRLPHGLDGRRTDPAGLHVDGHGLRCPAMQQQVGGERQCNTRPPRHRRHPFQKVLGRAGLSTPRQRALPDAILASLQGAAARGPLRGRHRPAWPCGAAAGG